MADSLAARVKNLARQMGAAKVGIAGVEALSGPPTVDASRVLPGARSVVSFLVVEPEGAVLKYLAKEDPWEYRDHFYSTYVLQPRTASGKPEPCRTGARKGDSRRWRLSQAFSRRSSASVRPHLSMRSYGEWRGSGSRSG
jgi:hypothetical protein